MSFSKLFIIFLSLLALSACTQAPDVTSTKPAEGVQSVVEDEVSPAINVQSTLEATPSLSESAIIGQVVSLDASAISNTEVRLATVFWNEDKSQGSFLIDESVSPITMTDENGLFVFDALEPRDYVIVIGDLYGQNVILSNNDGSAQIFTAEAGQILDVDVLQIDLESAPITIAPSPESSYPPPNTPSSPAYP